MIDDEYMLVGAHVDEATYNKIIEGKYVDFGKLIPHDRIAVEEDQRLEMIIRGGKTYWVPATETTSISNVIKWEQAFRVYSNIYTKQFPLCASKLIEYNHVIHSISSVYTWDNVYSYDKDFHIHMGKNPNCNWSIILQHSWSLRLRDKISRQDNSSGFNHNNNHKSGGGKSSDPCRRYNKGKCNFGPSCRYDHKCSYCFKFGHTILNCRKLQADRECGTVCKHFERTNDRKEPQGAPSSGTQPPS